MKKKNKMFINKLDELSDKELFELCNEYIELYNLYNGFSLSLKNNNVCNTKKFIMDNIDKYVSVIIKYLSNEEIKALRYVIKLRKVQKNNLDYAHIKVLDYFKKFLLIDYQLDNKYYIIYKYKDIVKMIKKIINKKGIFKENNIFNKNNILIRGIVNYRGAISVNDMLTIVKEYTDIKDLTSLKNLVLLDSKITGSYKVITKNRKLLCINNCIEKDVDIEAWLKFKNTITYDEYISYGDNSFKLNKSYKKFIRYIKTKYLIKKKEMYYLNNYILLNYCSLYKVDKTSANKFVLDNISKLFELRNEGVKSDILSKIETIALEYNLGGNNE